MKATSYNLKELAVMYFPNSTVASARNQLKRWFILNHHLMKDLEETGYVNGQRVFTPRQVALIFHHLGEP